MEADQFKDLLKRYEENTLSPQEKLLLERWYESYEEDEFTGFSSAAHAERIKQDIKTVVMPVEREEQKTTGIHWRRIYRYAAILTLLVPAFFFFKKEQKPAGLTEKTEQFTTYTTTAAESKRLTLQDHSIVHLNPSSSLRISSRFGTLPNRDVFLEKGNAFFEVAKDRRHPFIVHAQSLSTRVLGTKFKVSNTANDKVEVSVSEGKVQVSQAKKVLALLLPGKKLVLDQKEKRWEKTDFGINENNNWYKAVANLNDADFEEVARTVKIYYGVTLSSENPSSLNYRYNLQIRSERTLDQTIKMICSVRGNNYRRTADGIVIY
ncbi:FecR family protein [Pedobacter sp. AW31-3R]|uniref:FecR family protein n=1 Tax=Pedobacter sp. AW31-3R TaxID=3445781 RepID=UPI003F9FE1C8